MSLTVFLALGGTVLPEASAQVTRFTQTIGGSECEEGFGLAATRDGGFVLSGFTTTYGSGGTGFCGPMRHDMLVTRYDARGALLWARTIGAAEAFDVGWGIVELSSGDFVVAGTTSGFGAGSLTTLDLLVSKLDSSGVHLWTNKLGGGGLERGYGVLQALDGDLVVAGRTTSFGAGSSDLLLLKLDTSGQLKWAQTLGGSAADFDGYYGPSVAQAADGALVVAGSTTSFGAGDADVILSKFDVDGNHLWTRTLGGSAFDSGNSVVVAPDGGFVVAGSTKSFGDPDGDVLVCKFDADGTYLWTTTLGGDLGEYGAAMVTSLSGGYVVAGATTSFGSTKPDLVIMELDADGGLRWASSIRIGSAAAIDYGKSLARLADGAYVMSGEVADGTSNQAPIVKLDAAGTTCGGASVPLSIGRPTPAIGAPTPAVSPYAPPWDTIVPTTTAPVVTIVPVCEATVSCVSRLQCDDSNECTDDSCAAGSCQNAPDDTNTCSGGTCRGGVCCTGCWDGAACQSGDSVALCGLDGRPCVDCGDTNPCTSDICAGGTCEHPPSGSCLDAGLPDAEATPDAEVAPDATLSDAVAAADSAAPTDASISSDDAATGADADVPEGPDGGADGGVAPVTPGCGCASGGVAHAELTLPGLALILVAASRRRRRRSNRS